MYYSRGIVHVNCSKLHYSNTPPPPHPPLTLYMTTRSIKSLSNTNLNNQQCEILWRNQPTGLGRDKRQKYSAQSKMMTHKMDIDLTVFSMLMKNIIVCNLNCVIVIVKYRSRIRQRDPKNHGEATVVKRSLY